MDARAACSRARNARPEEHAALLRHVGDRKRSPCGSPYLATIMGTSVREIEDTYFRWLTRTDEQLCDAFDAYDTRRAVVR